MGIVSVLPALASASPAETESPKAAIVISRTSYFARQGEVSGAAKSWTAIASLAGLPYSTLFVEDLASDNILSDYEVVVLSQCTFLTDSEYAIIDGFVGKLPGSGCSLIVDAPVGLFDEQEDYREDLTVDAELGISVSSDYVPIDGFRLRVSDNGHFVTAGYEKDAAVSNYLVSELPVMSVNGGQVLVYMTDDSAAYPYLTVCENDGFRLAVADGLSSAACVGASFRNYAPKGFFPSEVYPIMRRTLQWCAVDETDKAFPSLLVSGGDMTAIIRVDGDGSQVPASMDLCMTYLEDIADETGVQAIMTYVSSWAARGGWHFYADHSRRLQEQGSAIGTHTMNHRLSELSTPEDYALELDGSKEEIRAGLSSCGYDPGEIRFLVNPGDGAAMHDYGKFAGKFDFFLTHGLDQSLPVAYGVLTWFTDGKPFPVANDGPSPDYQWFYDSTWSYTASEVADYERAVLDHLCGTVGNGVIFNAMWHDYGMSKMLAGEPRNVTEIIRKGTRIINDDNSWYYETIRNFWNTHDIYCPEPAELTAKMLLQAGAAVSWSSEGDVLTVRISFPEADFEKYAPYAGGMALGLNGATIASVEMDGQPYYAFSDDKIILPVPDSPETVFSIHTGNAADGPRLTYSSKVLNGLDYDGNVLTAEFNTRSVARFRFDTELPSVLVGASSFDIPYGSSSVSGRLEGSGKVSLVPVGSRIRIQSSTLPLASAESGESGLTVTVMSNGSRHNKIVYNVDGVRKVLDIPAFEGKKTITLK